MLMPVVYHKNIMWMSGNFENRQMTRPTGQVAKTLNHVRLFQYILTKIIEKQRIVIVQNMFLMLLFPLLRHNIEI